MPREPLHTFRASEELWGEVQAIAEANGEPVSEILRRALEEYRDAHREKGRRLARASRVGQG